MRERFGLPDITGHRRFVTAVGVDALGSGIFMPVAVLYFLNTTALTLPEVGLVLSFAGAAGFPVILFVGGLVDRLGAKRVLLAANALQAAAYLGYPLARSFGAVLAVGVGALIFWHAFFNLGMVTGILPVVGVTLPLFSYGGSSVLTVLMGIGLLMNVSMRRYQGTTRLG